MIREITSSDIAWANELLREFNCCVEDYKDNPFSHIIIYDNKGIVVYSKIYNRIEIEYIIVNNKYRNNGIGTKLLKYIIDNNDITNITLEVSESNNSAIKFYQHNGFKKVAIREKYYNNENGVLMIREFDNND